MNSLEEIIPQIPVDRLDVIIQANSYVIIDVRDSESIKTQGPIPGAIHMPFDGIDHEMNKEDEAFNDVFKSDGPFLFCCTGGVMSYAAALKAQEKGIKNISNLEGGHAAWMKMKELPVAV